MDSKALNALILPHECLGSKLGKDYPIRKLTNRSTEVEEGTLFFAIGGSNFDGHQFIDFVLSRRGIAVVENEEFYRKFDNTVLVPSTRHAFGVAAARWFNNPSADLNLVGVTGTNGKTTTTYLLRDIWNRLNVKSGLVGTVQSIIGGKSEPTTLTTPDAYDLQQLFSKMRTEKVTHAALEVSSIALEQSRVSGSEFKVGVFTNLTQDHMDYHKDFESYYRAKRLLFTRFSLKSSIINIDDIWGKKLFEEQINGKKISFSIKTDRATFSVSESSFDKSGLRAELNTPVGPLSVQTPLIGRHNLYNVLAALATTFALQQDLNKAIEALRTTGGAPGRLERIMHGEEFPNIFVDYAHTEDALRNVLAALSEIRGKASSRVITVFGCGGDRDRAKRPGMAKAVSELSDITVATSDNPRTEDPDEILNEVETGIAKGDTEFYRERNRKDAIFLALSLAQPSDIVLIAGKGHETYQIVGTERLAFDDRKVIREFYQK